MTNENIYTCLICLLFVLILAPTVSGLVFIGWLEIYANNFVFFYYSQIKLLCLFLLMKKFLKTGK